MTELNDEHMCWQEKYARVVAAEYNVRYNDADCIAVKGKYLEKLKKILSILQDKGIQCSDIKCIDHENLYYILIDF